MSRIVLSGYYGFGNAGDEAMLEAIVTDLRSYVPRLRVTVLSADPQRTVGQHPVEAVDRTNLAAITGALARSDALVSGGGSLLQDVTSERNLFYYLGIMALARGLLRPVILYGQGIGPIRRRAGRAAVRATLNRAALITVRDAASQDELLELGVRRPPLHVTADPALSLELGDDTFPPRTPGFDPGEALRAAGLDPDGGPVFGVFPREWPRTPDFVPVLARIADHLVTSLKARVALVPLQVPRDLAVCRAVREAMRRPEGAGVVEPGPGPRDALTLVSRLDVVLGIRLHALIFAALAGVPMVGLSYDPKVDRFLDALGQGPAIPLDRVEVEEACYRLETAWRRRENLEGSIREAVARLRSRARESARLAAAVLQGEPAHA